MNYYLEKSFVIIEHNSKHLISVYNRTKQRINVIDKKTDYVMTWYTEISSAANTLKCFHIQSNLYTVYKHKF